RQSAAVPREGVVCSGWQTGRGGGTKATSRPDASRRKRRLPSFRMRRRGWDPEAMDEGQVVLHPSGGAGACILTFHTGGGARNFPWTQAGYSRRVFVSVP